eukprot:TRINITY_DN79979_c0_g1_i1.p1 TRINITY_DN79979_c0_g1~~TRINITY_DN79979_c0_g1_i1.p1  ORF type:complete len:137 (-),score=38.10 TRINITY_DN79979_c0_g1_i1:179-589(-)
MRRTREILDGSENREKVRGVEEKMDDTPHQKFLKMARSKLPCQVTSNRITALEKFASELGISVEYREEKFDSLEMTTVYEVVPVLNNGGLREVVTEVRYRAVSMKIAKEQVAKQILNLLSTDEAFFEKIISFSMRN